MYTMMIQIHRFRLLISSMVAADMMILHALIVIICIPFEKSSQKAVHEDIYGITWNYAKEACKPYGLENREYFLRRSGIRDENEFWIGKAIYRVPTRWFEIIGCFQIEENHIHSFPAVASIGYLLSIHIQDSNIDTATTTTRPLYTFNKSKDENVNTSPDPLLSLGSDKGSFQSTAAVIGGILGACSMFAVSAVLIVYKIRSKGILKESNTYEKGETSQLHLSNTINQNSTSTRNMKVNDLCETGASGYSDANDLTKPENMNETYYDAADGEYDVLHDKQNRTMCPLENVYHSHGAHRNEDGPTYDSAAIVKENHNDGNELYDTSFSVAEGEYSYMSYKNHDHSMATDIYDKST